VDPPEKETPLPSVLGGEKGKRGGSSDHDRRLCRYFNAKSHTRSIMEAIGPDRAKKFGLHWKRITECGNWLLFRDYKTVGKTKLIASNFCHKHLVCSLCAIRRSSKLMAAYLQKYQSIRAEVHSLSAHLATLTVRNSHNLPEVFEHLLASLRLLNRRRNNATTPSIMDSVDGGVYAIELTHDEATGWHPHVHCIWLSRDPAMHDQAATYRLRAEWEQITGDSFMCDIRPIVAETNLPDDIDPHAGGFAEVFKYAMKPSQLGADRMIEALPYLIGRRLVGSFGWLRGVPEPDDLADILDGYELLPYEEFLVRFVAGQGYKRDLHTAAETLVPA
jgi:hypothetical protein